MTKGELDAMESLLSAVKLAHSELVLGGDWETAQRALERAAARARPFLKRAWSEHYPDVPMYFGFPWERKK